MLPLQVMLSQWNPFPGRTLSSREPQKTRGLGYGSFPTQLYTHMAVTGGSPDDELCHGAVPGVFVFIPHLTYIEAGTRCFIMLPGVSDIRVQ